MHVFRNEDGKCIGSFLSSNLSTTENQSSEEYCEITTMLIDSSHFINFGTKRHHVCIDEAFVYSVKSLCTRSELMIHSKHALLIQSSIRITTQSQKRVLLESDDVNDTFLQLRTDMDI